MTYKKLITCAMIGTMLLPHSLVVNPGNVYAAVIETVDSKSSVTVNQDETLKKLLESVRTRINIPKDFSKFDYSYESYGAIPQWCFQWTNSKDTQFITISVDDNGNILRYNFNDSSEEQEYGAAKYLKEELKGKALDFLKTIVPNDYKSLKYIDCDYYYGNSYSYHFGREKNGIVVSDQEMVVRVNASSGKVISFQSDWNYSVKFPSSVVNISKEKARELIKENLDFALQYQDVYSEEQGKMIGKLLYAPSKTYLAVNAHSGKVYDSKSVDDSNVLYGAKTTATEGSVAKDTASIELSEEEIAKITDLSGLITKNEAIQIIKTKDVLYYPSKEYEEQASLMQNVLDASKPNEKSYVWNIMLQSFDENSYLSYINAQIDAKTGQILSFYSEPYYRGEITDSKNMLTINEEAGLSIAKQYVAENYSKVYRDLEYSSSSNGYVLDRVDDDIIYGSKIYTFTRMHKGVPFQANNIRIGVDLITGKIYLIDYNWYDNVTFEENKNTITKSQAMDSYLSFDGFDLAYEIVYSQDEGMNKATSRLVYRTEMEPYYVNPYTGEQVNDRGEKEVVSKGYSYSDIKGTDYERAILILADMGIGFADEKFKPDQAITVEEFNQLLMKQQFSYGMVQMMTGNGSITRELAAKYVICALNLEYIGKLDIYKADYKDINKIKKANLGYVVLADELGLITSKNNSFSPTKKLTRGEAANLILEMLSYSMN